MQIQKFDPHSVADGKVTLIIGKRGTGKSVLLKDLMFYKRHYTSGVVMSGTEEGNGWYKGWVPDLFVFNQFDVDVISKIVKRQKRLSTEKRAKPVFIVLDDCMYDKKILKDTVMRAIFMNGRHWKIHLWCTAQYLMDVPPDIRMQIDYVFAFKDSNMLNRKKLYNNFFGVFRNFNEFCLVMDKCTNNHECLVMNNTTHSNDIQDSVYWYKAKTRKFRMGADEMWRFHQTNYNPDHDDGAAAEGKHGITVVKKSPTTR